MKTYQAFVDQLENHLRQRTLTEQVLWEKNSETFLNGLASEELRRLVDIDARRASGAFFTESEMAYQIIANCGFTFSDNAVIYDPAVGAGNLLLAALRVANTKVANIRLLGTDIHETFIKAANLRLTINGHLTGKSDKVKIKLSVGDGLSNSTKYIKATHIVTNPPFNLIEADKSIRWCKGKVSAAAVFIEKIIEYVNPGVQILAILPDVLRSGSRYLKWRQLVAVQCEISNLTKLGQFDRHTDIDVFSVILIKRNNTEGKLNFDKWSEVSDSDNHLSNHFDISVGQVVDNRDKHEGARRPYLVSRGLSGWQVITEVNRSRQFSGRCIKGPFVVIKRTSRMGDKHRAIATLINVTQPIYVDNHLIIAKPKSGKLSDCKKLIKALADIKIDEWIDEQIRCRHLTVRIVERIPYNG